MYRIIYLFITLITKLHQKFIALSISHGLDLTDKQLHFLIIGLFGFCMLFVIQPIFRWLAKHDVTLLITFIYVFTVVIVITFGIEIGQAYSGSGDMDFYDIASGVLGFFAFFCIYLVFYLIYKRIRYKKI
ncbi:MAG: hypothetical protein IKS51_07155 [Erysipelotrichaceae bacterium]|nr:hypothetical protein [Erysipelotrichaceae bacterium]